MSRFVQDAMNLFGRTALLLAVILMASACEDSAPPEGTGTALRSPVQLTAEVDRAEATTGDVIHYTVTLDRDPEIVAEMPDVFSQIEGFLVSDIKRSGPINRDGRIVQEAEFELQAFEVGSYILPALEVVYTDPRGEEQTAGTPQIFVEIKSVLNEASPTDTDGPEATLADIKPALAPPPDYRNVALLGIGGVLLLSLVGGALMYWRRSRQEEPMPPPVPPWEVALEELSRLEKVRTEGESDSRLYCYKLSEIFRRYLEDRFEFPALEETTEEILSSFGNTAVPRGRSQELARRVLTGTDWVKYAKQDSTEEETGRMSDAAKEFIRTTIPSPEVEPESNAKEVS